MLGDNEVASRETMKTERTRPMKASQNLNDFGCLVIFSVDRDSNCVGKSTSSVFISTDGLLEGMEETVMDIFQRVLSSCEVSGEPQT